MATTVAAPARVFGSGIKRREDPRLLTGTARYTADYHAARTALRGDSAQPAWARADQEDRHGRREGRARRRRGVHRRRYRRRAADDSVRVAGAELGSEDGAVPARWRRTSSATSATPSRSSSPNRRSRRADAVDLIEVDYDPLPATVDPEQAVEARRAAAARRGAEQHRLPLDGRRRRRRRRVQERRRRRPRSHRPAAADPDGDGDARARSRTTSRRPASSRSGTRRRTRTSSGSSCRSSAAFPRIASA